MGNNSEWASLYWKSLGDPSHRACTYLEAPECYNITKNKTISNIAFEKVQCEQSNRDLAKENDNMGAEIDYKEDLQGAQFIIRNPNAATTCGCGSSFSV